MKKLFGGRNFAPALYFVAHTCALGLIAPAMNVQAARKTLEEVPSSGAERPPWLLNGFLRLAAEQPRRLLRLGDKLFSAEHLRITQIEPSYAFDWQHRIAVVQALSHIFEPDTDRAWGTEAEHIRTHARKLLRTAMTEDPSLLVRDGAVESVRRIVRMRPREGAQWGNTFEQAFFDERNHVEGEGLFIRETILTALREASLRPSRRLRKAAERDLNPEVRGLLRNWNTSAYDDIDAAAR